MEGRVPPWVPRLLLDLSETHRIGIFLPVSFPALMGTVERGKFISQSRDVVVVRAYLGHYPFLLSSPM